jgi:hypothetical protein
VLESGDIEPEVGIADVEKIGKAEVVEKAGSTEIEHLAELGRLEEGREDLVEDS